MRRAESVPARDAKKTWPYVALRPPETPEQVFQAPALAQHAYFADPATLIFRGDACGALQRMADAGLMVDCIVTSPPFYGQRDYQVDGQIGLELDPAEYIARLVAVFSQCIPILKSTGSLWVNLGDTYWSGRGQHRSGESKQSARRFGLRPQDHRRGGTWTRSKQLLLIPHRFAIAMQDAGWIVRNDNVWVKPNPLPDQVRDRCSTSHEYVFHFVRERFYYFNRAAVGRRTSTGRILPPLDTWEVPPSRGARGHKAAFSEELIDVPIRATTPPNGVVLDPFAGSGTALVYARKLGYRSVGIDLKEEYCAAMAAAVRSVPLGPQTAAGASSPQITSRQEPLVAPPRSAEGVVQPTLWGA